MITEKTLKKWRAQALINVENAQYTRNLHEETAPNLAIAYIDSQNKILRMTQELLDQHLMRRKS